MAWYDENSWLTRMMGPYLSTIILGTIVVISLPILLHWILYKQQSRRTAPHFLILGPSDSGKTALITKLETKTQAAPTHTSIVPVTIQTHLPTSNVPQSSRYRSAADHERSSPKPVLFTDTPGHAKLRHFAYSLLSSASSSSSQTPPITGAIFVVDSSNLSSGGGSSSSSSALADTAAYLHDALLALQRAHSRRRTSRAREMPVLIASNKSDLFTSLPAAAVRSSLEAEIGKIRQTRARGIAAVGRASAKSEGLDDSDAADQQAEEELEPLAGQAEGKFEFRTMQEWNVHVSVVAGNVLGEEGPGMEGWWDWVAGCM